MLTIKDYFTLRGIAACAFITGAIVAIMAGVEPTIAVWLYAMGLYFAIAAELEYIRHHMKRKDDV